MAAKVSIEEAAQLSVEEIEAKGRFNMRGLAEGLGIMADEERKSAFMSGTNEKMAKMIRAALDEREGGGKSSKKGSVTRQPSNKKAAAAAAAEEDEAPAAPSGKKGGTDDLSKLAAAIQANTKAIEKVLAQVRSLAAIASGTNRFSVVQFGLLTQLAEQVLEADGSDIMDEVGKRMDDFEGLLTNLAGAETEEGEEEEEGNS